MTGIQTKDAAKALSVAGVAKSKGKSWPFQRRSFPSIT